MEPAATSKEKKEHDDGSTSNRIVFCGITLFIIHNGKQRRARAQMTRKKRKRKPSRTFSQMKTALPILQEANFPVGIEHAVDCYNIK